LFNNWAIDSGRLGNLKFFSLKNRHPLLKITQLAKNRPIWSPWATTTTTTTKRKPQASPS
jgi:hypothetical protein